MEVVGSGTNPSLLPLDIPYAKTVDWLVERQVIAKGSWQKTLRTAHTKLEAALEAERPPVAAATDALGPAGSRTQQGTTYFDCVKVLQALKDAGLDEKSFLGAYSNPHTARWADVVKRFESGSVFLVDAAQYLVHSCSYELPALRQEMTRAERELAELQRRQAEYVRLAEASQARFVQACSHKKISASAEDSAGLSDELRLSLSQLRPLYEAVARRVQQEPLPKGVQEYKEIVGFALDKTEPPPADPQAAGAAAGSGTRGQLLDDLFELNGFYTQYAAELAAGANASALPNDLQLDKAEVAARLAAVGEAINALDNEHARHLLMLGSSEAYLKRQVANLRQMLDSSEKMRRRAEELQTRQAELQLMIKAAQPKYAAVVGSIKGVKASLEAALSKKFDGRRVNLMGDINNL